MSEQNDLIEISQSKGEVRHICNNCSHERRKPKEKGLSYKQLFKGTGINPHPPTKK